MEFLLLPKCHSGLLTAFRCAVGGLSPLGKESSPNLRISGTGSNRAWGFSPGSGDMRIRPFMIAAVLAMSAALTGCMGGSLMVANYSAMHDAGYTVPAIPI